MGFFCGCVSLFPQQALILKGDRDMILAFVYVDRASQGASFPLEYIDEE